MKLLTKEIERKFEKFPFYSQDGRGKDSDVIVKFFNPCGSQTWLVTEAESKTTAIGICTVGTRTATVASGRISRCENCKALSYGLGLVLNVTSISAKAIK